MKKTVLMSLFVVACSLLYAQNDTKGYDDVYSFSEGLAMVKLNGKWGFIDKTGKEIIPLKYDGAHSFSEGLVVVELNEKYGFIDTTGKEVIPLKYDDAWSFSEGLANVKLNGKWGIIDKTGKEVIPPKYDDAWSFSEGLAMVKLNAKYGFIDKTGKEVIPLKYDRAGYFSEGLVWIELNEKYGFIDTTGKEVIPPKYDGAYSYGAYPFREGLARVKLNEKYGFIDTTGKEVIPLKYDDAYPFREGLAMVKLNDKWGGIDTTGKEVIPPKYDDAWSFSEGLAMVELNGKWGFIDKTGKEVIPLKYDIAGDFSEGLALVELNEKYGFIDTTGKEVIPLKYDRAWNFKEGFAIVELNGKQGFIDRTGKEVISHDQSGKDQSITDSTSNEDSVMRIVVYDFTPLAGIEKGDTVLASLHDDLCLFLYLSYMLSDNALEIVNDSAFSLLYDKTLEDMNVKKSELSTDQNAAIYKQLGIKASLRPSLRKLSNGKYIVQVIISDVQNTQQKTSNERTHVISDTVDSPEISVELATRIYEKLRLIEIDAKRPYVAHTTSVVNMREAPGTNSAIMTKLAVNSYLVLFSLAKENDFYKVLNVQTGDEGYVHANYVKIDGKLAVDEGGNLTVVGKSQNDYDSEVVVKNATQYKLTIQINSVPYVLNTGETRTIVVSPGSTLMFASVSNKSVKPYFGTENLKGGYSYSWEFVINTIYDY
jgi:hypothetical protein